jgi:hypothetical protein
MATFNFIPIPAQSPATVITGLATATSSVEQALGTNTIFAINSNEDITIRFGPKGFGTAAGVGDFRIPAGSIMTWDTGNQYTSFKCYNLGSVACNIYIMFISKF